MKHVLLIRHGMTAGNREGRYIGRTDQPLCAEGIAQAKTLYETGLPACAAVFSSPYLRCRQTAAILFPKQAARIIPDLRECDFGAFEGKTAHDLRHDPAYAAWLDTSCTAPIPGGESVSDFKARCCAAFSAAMQTVPDDATAALVLHGGCIMAILEQYARPPRPFYAWHVANCGLVCCVWDENALTVCA